MVQAPCAGEEGRGFVRGRVATGLLGPAKGTFHQGDIPPRCCRDGFGARPLPAASPVPTELRSRCCTKAGPAATSPVEQTQGPNVTAGQVSTNDSHPQKLSCLP